jgi:hypothetical protein
MRRHAMELPALLVKDERCGVVPETALPGAAACAIVTVTTFRGGAMDGMRQRQEVEKFVCAALECSVYVAPKEPGLTHEELLAVGRAAGFENGEIADALSQVAAPIYFGGDNRILPQGLVMWADFNFPDEPDYRNPEAFDFACVTLREIARRETAGRAQIDRDVLVARAVAKGLPKLAIEAAITILVLDERFVEKDGALKFAPGRDTYALPSEQIRDQAKRPQARQIVRRNEARAKAYALVKDAIQRRSDGRPKAIEALDAFGDALEKLGYGHLCVWWARTVAELRHAEPALSPTTVTVFAAALVEGALTFVVKHARDLGLGVFGSKDFDRDPRTWKVDDLVASASTGNAAAILDPAARHRADELVKFRQRIHAGRMLSDFPGAVPDLRPEEARAAKESAEVIVRRVLDWLEKHPAVKTDGA